MNRSEFLAGAEQTLDTHQPAVVSESPDTEDIKFDPVQNGLPLAVESQCLDCERVVQAEMTSRNGRVILRKQCPEHGPQEEELYDVLFTDAISDRPNSPEITSNASKPYFS